ncbi:dTDP-4-oxo-6-deoxy-D-allose reductase [subsurface metagenome]
MRIDDGRALPTFMMQALQGKFLTVYGDGTQTRSFCYVNDLIEGIYKLLRSDVTEPINLGNPDEISIIDFAAEVIKITNSKSEITFKTLPVNDPKVRRPNITKAKELLNWDPEVTRREGLKKVAKYFKSLTI